jgi:hypothetical protein
MNARSLAWSCGTWVLFTLETVGADEADDQVAATLLSFEVKVTLELEVCRDHPSGTLTTKWPLLDR